jgi:flagellar biosynthesis protein FlhB
MPIAGALLIFHAFLMKVVIRVGIFFIVIAVLDFAYQKYNFGKEMMMEKFEIKQEYKNTEGDPQIKSKRRQTAQEIAYSEGPAAGVQRSKAVITNPIHLAVAVDYDREIDQAPFITAMGDGPLAERIIFYAEKYNVPIVRNIPLAHKLWEDGEIHEYVPEDTYEALAEIITWVSNLNQNPEKFIK